MTATGFLQWAACEQLNVDGLQAESFAPPEEAAPWQCCVSAVRGKTLHGMLQCRVEGRAGQSWSV